MQHEAFDPTRIEVHSDQRRVWEEEASFQDVMAEQLRHAPWFGISILLHLAAVLLLSLIAVPTQRKLIAEPISVATIEEIEPIDDEIIEEIEEPPVKMSTFCSFEERLDSFDITTTGRFKLLSPSTQRLLSEGSVSPSKT